VKPSYAWVLVVCVFTGCGQHRVVEDKLGPRILFERMPHKIRESMFPMTEVDTAMAISQATSKGEVVKILQALVLPGQRVEGWVCQVNLADLPDEQKGSQFALLFPERVLGLEVWIGGLNYLNANRQNFQNGDWVTVSGVFDATSKVRWTGLKSSSYLSLGEITVTQIEKLQK
jgi:hypothetical protein